MYIIQTDASAGNMSLTSLL